MGGCPCGEQGGTVGYRYGQEGEDFKWRNFWMVMSMGRVRESPGKLHWVGGEGPSPPGDSVPARPPWDSAWWWQQEVLGCTSSLSSAADRQTGTLWQWFQGRSFSACPGGRDLAPKLVGVVLPMLGAETKR